MLKTNEGMNPELAEALQKHVLPQFDELKDSIDVDRIVAQRDLEEVLRAAGVKLDSDMPVLDATVKVTAATCEETGWRLEFVLTTEPEEPDDDGDTAMRLSYPSPEGLQ